MAQLGMHRMQLQAVELVRDFYESIMMVTVGALLQWNQLHVVRILNGKRLIDELTDQQAADWSTIFFVSGLLLNLTQYRPQWIKRCAPPMREFFLLVELFALLFVVDFVLLSIWQPSFDILDHALNALGHAQWPLAKLVFHYWPEVSTWLIHDAFSLLHTVTSLWCFLVAMEVAAPKWRLALDFLLLDQLPEINESPPSKRKRNRTKVQSIPN